jgi:hypothetical protein
MQVHVIYYPQGQRKVSLTVIYLGNNSELIPQDTVGRASLLHMCVVKVTCLVATAAGDTSRFISFLSDPWICAELDSDKKPTGIPRSYLMKQN